MTQKASELVWIVWRFDQSNQIALVQVILIHSRKRLSSQCFNEVRIFQGGCSSFCTRSFKPKSSACSTLHTNLNLMCLSRLRVESHRWRRSKLETHGALGNVYRITTTSTLLFRLQTVGARSTPLSLPTFPVDLHFHLSNNGKKIFKLETHSQ